MHRRARARDGREILLRAPARRGRVGALGARRERPASGTNKRRRHDHGRSDDDGCGHDCVPFWCAAGSGVLSFCVILKCRAASASVVSYCLLCSSAPLNFFARRGEFLALFHARACLHAVSSDRVDVQGAHLCKKKWSLCKETCGSWRVDTGSSDWSRQNVHAGSAHEARCCGGLPGRGRQRRGAGRKGNRARGARDESQA